MPRRNSSHDALRINAKVSFAIIAGITLAICKRRVVNIDA